jgi:DNA-binding NtrC family response regulator
MIGRGMAAVRVLVVDDDALMLATVSRMLSGQGYEVISSVGPRQALEIIRTLPPIQTVVSDIGMPEMLGTQLMSEVLRLSPQTAGLLMTGDVGSMPDVPEGVAVLRSPFSIAELILAVQSRLTESVEFHRRMGELAKRNERLRSELEEVQKSIELRRRPRDSR